jgi:UPF0271 protein
MAPDLHVDLNADLGESGERWADGHDQALLDVVTSANVCCGAYAGNEALMLATCQAAAQRGVAVGAQIGYRDRAHFGRVFVDISPGELRRDLSDQIRLLDDVARQAGTLVTYVKPHGALYNAIVSHREHAQAVVDAVSEANPDLALLGLPGAVSLQIATERGLRNIHEGFADRAYTAHGTLVPRSEPGAVLTTDQAVAAQAVRLLGTVESVCVHSDSPGALALARAVRAALEAAGADVRRFA